MSKVAWFFTVFFGFGLILSAVYLGFLSTELSAEKQRNSVLVARLAELDEELVAKELELNKLAETVQDLNSELQRYREELKALDACRTEVSACFSDLDACLSDVNACSADLNACMGDLNVCQTDLNGCQENLATCYEDLEDYRRSLRSCRRRLDSCRDDLAACQSNLSSCQEDYALLKSYVDTLRTGVNNILGPIFGTKEGHQFLVNALDIDKENICKVKDDFISYCNQAEAFLSNYESFLNDHRAQLEELVDINVDRELNWIGNVRDLLDRVNSAVSSYCDK